MSQACILQKLDRLAQDPEDWFLTHAVCLFSGVFRRHTLVSPSKKYHFLMALSTVNFAIQLPELWEKLLVGRVFLEPPAGPVLGLLRGLQCAFELGDVHFLSQLSQSGAGDGAQAHQVVAVQQRLGLEFDVA